MISPERSNDEVVYGGVGLVPAVVETIVLCSEVYQTHRHHLDPLCVCVCVCMCVHVCMCVCEIKCFSKPTVAAAFRTPPPHTCMHGKMENCRGIASYPGLPLNKANTHTATHTHTHATNTPHLSPKLDIQLVLLPQYPFVGLGVQRSDRRVVAHLLRDDTVALLLVNQFIRFTEERVERLAVSEGGREEGGREGGREGKEHVKLLSRLRAFLIWKAPLLCLMVMIPPPIY